MSPEVVCEETNGENIFPEEARPWRRITVWECSDWGGMMIGSGNEGRKSWEPCFLYNDLRISMFGVIMAYSVERVIRVVLLFSLSPRRT